MENEIIKFLREKDFKLVKWLDRGGFGKTALLKDDIIDEQFVCKKYAPLNEDHQEIFFKNFVQEIKLLHLVYHPNIVRIYNYYLYPNSCTGYILMEYINGYNIEAYLEKYPENMNEIFLQIIDGFKHLEENKILHRDIRPQNIMIKKEDGTAKIIDFGFGKKVAYSSDFNKSISLNWWCETPNEFKKKIYDFKTEIYFVGKLFEKIIIEKNIETFKYKDILKKMCDKETHSRINTFHEVYKEILDDRFLEINFSEYEIESYRNFSNGLYSIVSKIDSGATYYNDTEIIQKNIEDLYKRIMLEKYLTNNSLLIQCFINGTYFYTRQALLTVSAIKGFIDLFRGCSNEKRNIMLNNIQTKLDSIEKHKNTIDDEVPF